MSRLLTTVNYYLPSKHPAPQIWEFVPQNVRKCKTLNGRTRSLHICHHKIFTVCCNYVALVTLARVAIIIFYKCINLVYILICLFTDVLYFTFLFSVDFNKKYRLT